MADEHRPVISLAEIVPLLQGPLIWSTWAWNHSNRRDVILDGWNLNTPPWCQPPCLLLLSLSLCLYLYLSYIFSHASGMTLGMVMLVYLSCRPTTLVETEISELLAGFHGLQRINATAWTLVQDIHGADKMNPIDFGGDHSYVSRAQWACVSLVIYWHCKKLGYLCSSNCRWT